MHCIGARCAPRVVTVRSAAAGGLFGGSYSPRPSWEERMEAHWARLGAAGLPLPPQRCCSAAAPAGQPVHAILGATGCSSLLAY